MKLEGAVRSRAKAGTDVAQPDVAILLCTYNGQKYLAEQLDSIDSQSYPNWQLWVSDDGSKDGTHEILETYQKHWPPGRLSIHEGPGQGFAANFLSLTCKADIHADHYAYADQDDIWDTDKLTKAVSWLETIPDDVPALYCSRTRLVDANNHEIGLSPLFHRPPSFANALTQNIAGGNTMVFNHAARMALSEIEDINTIVTHDWWAYLVVTGCGGQVFYDKYPTLRYRQHEENLVGMNATLPARFKRICMLWQGRFSNWSDSNIVALSKLRNKLTSENRQTLDFFTQARQMSLFPRLILLKRSGVYRQTLMGNLGLVLAAVLGKI
jgi:glycosyltransferase involved in cell wall biosynthesis